MLPDGRIELPSADPQSDALPLSYTTLNYHSTGNRTQVPSLENMDACHYTTERIIEGVHYIIPSLIE